MAASLIPGSLGDPSNFSKSMAKAMEDAFVEEWPLAMKGQPAPAVNDQMRLLFVAIAKGVVRHLKAQELAFVADVKPSNADGLGHEHEAPMSISVTVDPL